MSFFLNGVVDSKRRSLQLKVKKLEEEKEEGLREDHQQLDLPEDSKPGRSDQDRIAADVETDASHAERTAAKSAAFEESDRDNRSGNGSNSTGLKNEHEKAGGEAEPKREEDEEEPVRARTVSEKTDQVWEESKPEGVDSYNGSSEPNRERRSDESDELQDSVAQSKENSSDVQSSASLTRRKKRKGRRVNEISCAGSSGEAPDADEASLAINLAGTKSQRLLETLKLIRAHKHCSLFDRKVAVQEGDKYQNIVRQYMDMDIIQSRLLKGSYSSCSLAFYRDLLLLFNNTLVFYSKSSLEWATALELHRLISTELKKETAHAQLSTSTQEPPIRPKPELERSDSFLAKHKPSPTIIVCRKRSSFSAKPSLTAIGQKSELLSNNDKRPSSESKQQPCKAGVHEHENLMKVNNTVERSVTGTRSLRRSNTNLKGSTTTSPSNTTALKKSPLGSTEKADDAMAADPKKSEEAVASTKKRSAADFLKRIKRNSPTAKSKNTTGDPKNSKGVGGGADQKKKQTGKGDKGEEKSSRQSGGSSGAKHAKEDSSLSKRSVGRPPKKGVDSNAVGGKRKRDASGAKEVAAPIQKQPRKRSRRSNTSYFLSRMLDGSMTMGFSE
ncbi:hypothetical protein SAY86_000712 [Trapa natans]|uniref:Bromo domain-containing protein n=1 Tax=Trapa natans TaxID=22666 RepID=A0AAN7MBE2_TRANT|nr:hypothetical protein SAY86_000712 [Trapa natans]